MSIFGIIVAMVASFVVGFIVGYMVDKPEPTRKSKR